MSSLGWLTESALLPKKEAKKINVGWNSSLVDLKAKILEEKAKLATKTDASEHKILSHEKKSLFKEAIKNKGIQERAQKDKEEEFQVEDDKGVIDERKIQFKLQEKMKLYENLVTDKHAHVKGKEHLIDYEQKRWSKSEKTEEKKQYLSQMNQMHEIMERERKAWEVQARQEIDLTDSGKSLNDFKQANSASAKLGLSLAPLVKQQWDSILTDQEKEHLPEVIKDKERQKDLQLLAKRKREEEREARLQRIEEMKKRRKFE